MSVVQLFNKFENLWMSLRQPSSTYLPFTLICSQISGKGFFAPTTEHWVAKWSKCWHRFAFSRVLQSTSKSSMASHWVAKNSQFSMVHWKVGIYQWGKLIHYVRVHSVDSFSTIHIKSSLRAKVPELIFPWCPEQWWPGCVSSLLEDGWFTLAFALCILR